MRAFDTVRETAAAMPAGIGRSGHHSPSREERPGSRVTPGRRGSSSSSRRGQPKGALPPARALLHHFRVLTACASLRPQVIGSVVAESSLLPPPLLPPPLSPLPPPPPPLPSPPPPPSPTSPPSPPLLFVAAVPARGVRAGWGCEWMRGSDAGSRASAVGARLARLGSARLGSARLGSARLGSASPRLGPSRLGSATPRLAAAVCSRLGSDQLLRVRVSMSMNMSGSSTFF